MSLNDEQMVLVSQIAYQNLEDAVLPKGTPRTVENILNALVAQGNEKQRESAQICLNKIKNSNTGQDALKWIVKDVRNDQSNSGMYACMLDTNDGNAVVGFRGSEEHDMKDWIDSDLGLVNNVLTPQQKAAEQYTKYLSQKYGDDYDKFSFTGHSLGGNLAEHATFTADPVMKSKTDRCVSLDGPGFSKRYMKEHADQIAESADKVDHYIWSFVGHCLYPAPSTHTRIIKARTPTKYELTLFDFISPTFIPSHLGFQYFSNLLWRHDTVNLEIDEHGKVTDGGEDPVSKIVDELSKRTDFVVAIGFEAIRNEIIRNKDFLDNPKAYLKNFIANYVYNYSTSKNSDFYVSTSDLANSLGQLDRVKSQLSQVSGNVEQIRKRLAYQSPSGLLMKYHISRLVTKLQNETRTLEKLQNVGKNCLETYKSTERNIVNGE